MIHDKKDNSGKVKKTKLDLKEHPIRENLNPQKRLVLLNENFIICDPEEIIIYSK